MKLWRGDSDSQNIRQLRASVPTGDGLFTNMINSGNPFALSQQGFLASIHQHVVPGWNQSHFLSFSMSKQVALGFAVGHSGKVLRLSHQGRWDTLVAEVDLGKLTHMRNLGVGIDHYQFQECGVLPSVVKLAFMHLLGRFFAIRNRRSAGNPTTRNIAAIDVFAHLSHLAAKGVPIHPNALTFSKNDQEVLLLPLDPLYGGGAGATALLDFGCVSALDFYELI